MKKRLLPLVLLLALTGLWPPAYEPLGSVNTSFTLSNNPLEKTTIVLQGKMLLILNLPKTEKFNYVMLKLVGEQGALPMKKSKSRRKESYDVAFNLGSISNGYYSVEIYSAPEEYTAYSSYIRGQGLHIQVSDSSMDFVEPPTLAKNKEVFAANKQDNTTLSYFLEPSPNVQSDHPAIMEQSRIITAGHSTDYDKIKAVHDWVSGNIWYDCDEMNSGISDNNSALETLISKKSICVGYASLTAALLRAAGVPTKLVTGYVPSISSEENWTEELIASKKSNHVWNESYADGRWVILDTTWDSSNTYRNDIFSENTGMKSRKYFDITIEFLSTDRYVVPSEFSPISSR